MGVQHVEVEIGGKVRLLRFDFNAIADIEEYFNKGIVAIMDEERMGLSTIRALYWGGLKWKMKGLTISQTGSMIQKELEEGNATIADLMKPIAKAMQSSGVMGKKDAKNELIDADYEEIDEETEKN